MLNVVYITSRKQPQFQWFYDSLIREADGNLTDIRLILVSKHGVDVLSDLDTSMGSYPILTTKPKPSVWQGQHRLTKEDWFAASNARNTGLCYAQDGYIVYADDLSVIMPGWLSAVREALTGNYVVCGAYKKVRGLEVRRGVATHYEEFLGGMDQRWAYVNSDPTPAQTGWLFGCSCGMPVEALLAVNGWPEACDGLGFEDCCMGIVLYNAGYGMKYDRRMLTLESEELHHVEPAPRKEDWHFEDGKPVTGGNNHEDKSHAILHIAQQSKSFPNYFGAGGIRELREKILAGGEFPVMGIPEHDWYAKIALKDL